MSYIFIYEEFLYKQLGRRKASMAVGCNHILSINLDMIIFLIAFSQLLLID